KQRDYNNLIIEKGKGEDGISIIEVKNTSEIDISYDDIPNENPYVNKTNYFRNREKVIKQNSNNDNTINLTIDNQIHEVNNQNNKNTYCLLSRQSTFSNIAKDYIISSSF